jgi:uncharacterized membrane protein
MTDRALRLQAGGLALVGVAVMIYLLYVRHGGGAPICTGNGCATVQHSRYAELFGVPVAALGLGGFLAMLLTSTRPGERSRLLQAFVALTALGFSTYLLGVQLVAIGAVCEWCLAADALTTGLAAIAIVRFRVPG